MGIFSFLKRKKEPSAPTATVTVDVSSIRKAIDRKGKAPLKAMAMAKFTQEFRDKARERRRAGEVVDLESWWDEYRNDKEYGAAKVMLAELGITDSDIQKCMADALGGAISSTGAMKPSAGNNYYGTARNSPCPCGSGKKFKRCHGA